MRIADPIETSRTMTNAVVDPTKLYAFSGHSGDRAVVVVSDLRCPKCQSELTAEAAPKESGAINAEVQQEERDARLSDQQRTADHRGNRLPARSAKFLSLAQMPNDCARLAAIAWQHD
jgi:hypothetical protein